MAFHSGSPEMPVRRLEAMPRGLAVAIPILVVVGVAAFAAALLTDVERAWRAYHFNWIYFTTIAQGAVMLAVVVTIAKGMWSRPVRRFALSFVAFLPVAYLLVIPIFIGAEHIFPWIHHPVPGKDVYLNVPFMAVRMFVGLGILFGLSLAFAYWSLRPDVGLLRDQAPERLRGLYGRLTRGWRGQEVEELLAHRRHAVLAPATALAFAIVFGVMSWDFVMSLEPHWFSTLIGPYIFMGGFLGGLMAVSIMTMLYLHKQNLYDFILPTTLHDLGKLCFGFTIFWAYLFFSQFIVIWYGQLVHEQAFIVHRFSAPFVYIAQAVGVMLFALPFFGLMSVAAKKTTGVFATFAVISLLGLWLERYLLVYPSHYYGAGVLPLGWQEIGVALGFAGLMLFAIMAFQTRFPMFQLWLPASELELEGLEVPAAAPQETDRVVTREL